MIKRRALLTGLLFLPIVGALGKDGATRITFRQDEKHQVIEGFGTCINTWNSELASAYQAQDFTRFYLEKLGASALRIELWGGAAPVRRDRWQDISWHDFDFAASGGRGEVSARVAKQLHAASNGKIRVIATAWSPSAWMKVNESLGNGHPNQKNFALNLDSPLERGLRDAQENEKADERYRYVTRNKLRRDRYMHFAKLLVEWSRYYNSLGIDLYAISPANEPIFSHWFESCVYSPEEYAELVEVIGWMFANQGEKPMPIFGPEHMTGDVATNRQYLQAISHRAASLQTLTAVAAHGYVDGYAADKRLESTAEFGTFAASYAKNAWVTEGGFGAHEWPAPLHELAAPFVYALRDGNVSLLTTWQTLDGDQPTEHGLMTIGRPTKKTYAAMQFWRFIRPGMTRIGLSVDGPLDVVAFEDRAAGTIVLVLLNRTKRSSPISLQLQERRLVVIEAAFITDAVRNCEPVTDWHDLRALSLPAESVATIRLRISPVT